MGWCLARIVIEAITPLVRDRGPMAQDSMGTPQGNQVND